MKKPLDPGLWTPRSPEDTRALYAEWATGYDADLDRAGYRTPGRVAAALAGHLTDRAAPILDFGCGTGLSGRALKAQGFTTIDGTDITPEMLTLAWESGMYRRVWAGEPGQLGDVSPGDYAAITAVGVVSYGAAPPETLGMLVDALAPGGLLAFSYNDSTLADDDYMDAYDAALTRTDLLFADYGPHLIEKDMGSKVFVLRRT
jgi:Predicted methyltransferase (contains TPR repeat)